MYKRALCSEHSSLSLFISACYVGRDERRNWIGRVSASRRSKRRDGRMQTRFARALSTTDITAVPDRYSLRLIRSSNDLFDTFSTLFELQYTKFLWGNIFGDALDCSIIRVDL